MVNVLRLIHSEIILKEFNPDDVQRERGAVPPAAGTETIFTSDDRQNQGIIPMPTFATRPSTLSSTLPVESPQNYMVGSAKTANIGVAIRQIP